MNEYLQLIDMITHTTIGKDLFLPKQLFTESNSPILSTNSIGYNSRDNQESSCRQRSVSSRSSSENINGCNNNDCNCLSELLFLF